MNTKISYRVPTILEWERYDTGYGLAVDDVSWEDAFNSVFSEDDLKGYYAFRDGYTDGRTDKRLGRESARKRPDSQRGQQTLFEGEEKMGETNIMTAEELVNWLRDFIGSYDIQVMQDSELVTPIGDDVDVTEEDIPHEYKAVYCIGTPEELAAGDRGCIASPSFGSLPELAEYIYNNRDKYAWAYEHSGYGSSEEDVQKAFNILNELEKQAQVSKFSWVDRIQDIYNSYEEWEVYSDIYGLAQRLGYNDPRDAWEENSYVRGSVYPEDYVIVSDDEASEKRDEGIPYKD